ncbi:hypothetical protein OUZ56_010287 [Daphnia magna]|uniref:Transmembrane protein n=1 Tax=Daphnia magna TaxID=35525 RepID=A0ABR0AIJ7_9CRUS|nr:hypothetical protein OUZ56_010287 [Daphnia magna]
METNPKRHHICYIVWAHCEVVKLEATVIDFILVEYGLFFKENENLCAFGIGDDLHIHSFVIMAYLLFIMVLVWVEDRHDKAI